MGHREDLLNGAVRCLYEKGYARTTARDIVEASGTNLSSIGYHYGGMTNLLSAALERAVENWGRELAQALMSAQTDGLSGAERFELYWARMIEAVERHRPVLMATFDAILQMDHSPDVHHMLVSGMRDARHLWAEVFHGIDPELEPVRANQIGSLYTALVSGVLTQVLISPDDAPTPKDLTAAIRAVAAAI